MCIFSVLSFPVIQLKVKLNVFSNYYVVEVWNFYKPKTKIFLLLLKRNLRKHYKCAGSVNTPNFNNKNYLFFTIGFVELLSDIY